VLPGVLAEHELTVLAVETEQQYERSQLSYIWKRRQAWQPCESRTRQLQMWPFVRASFQGAVQRLCMSGTGLHRANICGEVFLITFAEIFVISGPSVYFIPDIFPWAAGV